MAGFSRRKEIVHEIDVAHEHGMPEGRVDWVGLSAIDQRARASAAELRNLLATRLHRARTQRSDTATQRIKDVNRQLPARLLREVRESGARGVLCKRFNLSRHFNPPFLFREVTRLSC